MTHIHPHMHIYRGTCTHTRIHTQSRVNNEALVECYWEFWQFLPFELAVKCISQTHVRSHWLRLLNQTYCLWHREWIAYKARKMFKAQTLMIITKDKPFWSLQICGNYKPEWLLVTSRPAEELILMEDHIQRSNKLHNICRYKNRAW